MLNQLIIKTMPLVPKFIIKQVASKYIAGPKLDDAVRATKELEAKGGWATIDVLGEFTDTKERALHETEMSLKVVEAIKNNNLKAYPSIKPTSLGLGIDFDFAYDNIKRVVQACKDCGINMAIDMENSPYTSETIRLYKKFRSEGFDNLGIVIQAYMRRSESDINDVTELKPFVRLCKGIYKEAPEIAYQGKEEVRNNYKKLFDQLFENDFYVCIATHDEPLIQYALDYIKKNNISKDRYEFQMLLGVRESRRDQLLKAGHNLRCYVPFGDDWYGYSTRRLKENPDVAGQIFKAIFFKG